MFIFVAVAATVIAPPADAQTVLFTGDETLNYFSASHLTDDLALPVIQMDGADDAALEAGDGAWFRSSGRRMRSGININIDDDENETAAGLASTATGADGTYMTAGSQLADTLDNRGHGAGFVLYDAKATTGMQNLKVSLYYNDSTPNYSAPGMADGDDTKGGNVAIRVVGVQSTGVATDPWDVDDFTYLAGDGRSGAILSAGNHRNQSGEGSGPVVDRLFFADSSHAPSSPDAILNPSADWQDLTFSFDAATGYDFLIFSVGGVLMDAVDPAAGADRFAFDNISFEAAPVTGLACDFNTDLSCDIADLDMLYANFNGDLAFDVNGDTVVDAADITAWLTEASDPANPYLGGTKTFSPGDVDLNGSVDSADLGSLLNNFGNSSGLLFGSGNINGDANVDSADLGIVLNNFGFTSPAAAAAVPEPSSLALLLTTGLGMLGLARRRRAQTA